MGIAGLQKAAALFLLGIGFILGWFSSGLVSGVSGLAAGLAPKAGPAAQQTAQTIKIGNSIVVP